MPAMPREQEIEWLKHQAHELAQALEQINKRIADLEPQQR
jgi:hypothetical protein